MIAMKILISIVVIILYKEIDVIVSERCSFPNEEFRNDSCEIYCRENSPSSSCQGQVWCMGQWSSGCFCKSGTVRYTKNIASEKGDCITIDDCTEEICDDNQTFKECFGGEEVCSCNGTTTRINWIEPVSACACNEGFIRYIDWRAECITRSECEKKKTNPTCNYR